MTVRMKLKRLEERLAARRGGALVLFEDEPREQREHRRAQRDWDVVLRFEENDAPRLD